MKLQSMHPKMVLMLTLAICSCNNDDAIAESEIPTNENPITNITGAIRFLDEAPESLELDVLVDDDYVFMFTEKVNHELRIDIVTDLSVPGDYFPDTIPDSEQTWENLIPGIILAGTRVNCYYLHYNNATYKDSFDVTNYLGCIGQYRVEGEITFNAPVLGIVMRADLNDNDHLGNSNAELGVPGVDYCEHNLQHFPGINIADGCQSDRFILSADRKTLSITNNTDIHHDNYRVIVAAENLD